jgi:DNA-binding transcriptional regulator YhcF (GntR family)
MITTFRDFAQAKQDSKTPKYQQLVNTLLIDIEKGNLQTGERLPSINEASEECYLSRDTVERAYSELHRLGVITSIFRKGYFISGKSAKTKTKIFFLVGKITENNKAIFNAFVSHAGKDVTVDIFTYNYKSENFREIINDHLGNYHYYVIMPHLMEETEENLKCLKKITGERLIFLDQVMPSLINSNSSILSNSGKEICQVMQQNAKYFKKYKTLNLVLTEEEYFDSELITGFRNFCENNNYNFQVLDGFQEEDVEVGNVYFTMEDIDLVAAIKSAQSQNLELGKQVGLISLNDSCYKEILAGGISIISSKPTEMGKLAADLVHGNKRQSLNVSMEMILRKSL